MCLSTVYINHENINEEVMKDVARIEAEGAGFVLINLFGEKKFIEGKITTIDLVEDHSVIFEKPKEG
ncbi:MAG: CooT family nickel-binding protein [Deltaproteobacteria bacterium]|nr:CooT family nickel-binding protein [Deltaproteobacteria bacterium]